MNRPLAPPLLALALALVACDPQEETPAPRPECEQAADASFKTYEVLGYSEKFFYVETPVLSSSAALPAAFRSDQPQSSYRWRIGSDPRVFTVPEVRLLFTSPQSLDAGLRTTYRNPCTGQVGTDSSTYSFSVRDFSPDSTYGFYQGSLTGLPADTFTFFVGMLPPRCVGCQSSFGTENFPKGQVMQTGYAPTGEYGYNCVFLLIQTGPDLFSIPGRRFFRGTLQFFPSQRRLVGNLEEGTGSNAGAFSKVSKITFTFNRISP